MSLLFNMLSIWNFTERAVGEEFTYNAGQPSSIPVLGRSAGEGISNPTQYSWASLVAQLEKNLPPMRDNWIWSLGWKDTLEKGKAIHSSIIAWRIPWMVYSMGSQRVGHNWVTLTSLHFSSRFIIAFLPRNKCLLISWLQSLSAVTLEPKKIKSVTVSIVSICHEVMGQDAMILAF